MITIHEGNTTTDTLSVELLAKYRFFNCHELHTVLTNQAKFYKYGECGMGLHDIDDRGNKILQFVSGHPSKLPEINLDSIQFDFAFSDEIDSMRTIDIHAISSEMDTLSDQPNLIITFAFFAHNALDTLGYQWTKV